MFDVICLRRHAQFRRPSFILHILQHVPFALLFTTVYLVTDPQCVYVRLVFDLYFYFLFPIYFIFKENVCSSSQIPRFRVCMLYCTSVLNCFQMFQFPLSVAVQRKLQSLSCSLRSYNIDMDANIHFSVLVFFHHVIYWMSIINTHFLQLNVTCVNLDSKFDICSRTIL